MREVLKEKIPLKSSTNEILDYSCRVMKKFQPKSFVSLDNLQPKDKLELLLKSCINFGVSELYILSGNKKITMGRLMTLMKGVGRRVDDLSFEPSFQGINLIKLKNKKKGLTESQRSRLISRNPVKRTFSGRTIFLTPMKQSDKRRKDSLLLSPFFTLKGNKNVNSPLASEGLLESSGEIKKIQQLYANGETEFNLIYQNKDKKRIKVSMILGIAKFILQMEEGDKYIYPFEVIGKSKIRLSRNDPNLFQLLIIEELGDDKTHDNEDKENNKENLDNNNKKSNGHEIKYLFVTSNPEERFIITKTFQLYKHYYGNNPEQISQSGEILNYKHEQIALTLRCLKNEISTFNIKLMNEENEKFMKGILQINPEYFIIHPTQEQKQAKKKQKNKISLDEESPLTIYWDESDVETNAPPKDPKIIEIILDHLNGFTLKCYSQKQRDLINRCILGFKSNKTDSFIIKEKNVPKNNFKKPQLMGTLMKKNVQIQLFPQSPKKSLDFEFFQTFDLKKINKKQFAYFAIFNDNGNSPIINLQSRNPFNLETCANSPLLTYDDSNIDRHKYLNKQIKQFLKLGKADFEIEIYLVNNFFEQDQNKNKNKNGNEKEDQDEDEEEREKENGEEKDDDDDDEIDNDIDLSGEDAEEKDSDSDNEEEKENDDDKEQEKEKELIKEKISLKLTQDKILIEFMDLKAKKKILLNKNYSSTQKLFAHSEKLTHLLYLDTSGNKFVFNCDTVIIRDLILNSYFIFREQYFYNLKNKTKKVETKKLLSDYLKIISPKNLLYQCKYERKRKSLYQYPKEKNPRSKEINPKFATYDLQFYNSLEEHIGPGQIFLYQDHFIIKFFSEKKKRYYSVYSKPLLLEQNSVFCRFHFDEKEYVNIAFPNLKQRNNFIKGFTIRKNNSINCNYNSPTIFKSILLKDNGEMIPIKINVRFDCFFFKSNYSTLRCEYLPDSKCSISKHDSDLIRINLGIGHSTIKCLFQNSIASMQFIKCFHSNKYKWLLGNTQNPKFYFNQNMKIDDHTNCAIAFTNHRLLCIKKNTQGLPTTLNYYSTQNSQLIVDNNNNNNNNNGRSSNSSSGSINKVDQQRNISKVVLNNKNILKFEFKTTNEQLVFNKSYKNIAHKAEREYNRLKFISKKLKSVTNNNILPSLIFHINFYNINNPNFKNDQGFLKLYPNHLIITAQDESTCDSKLINADVQLYAKNSNFLIITIKKMKFLISFVNPKHREYFIWIFGTIKKQKKPNYISAGKEIPITKITDGNNNPICKFKYTPLIIKFQNSSLCVVYSKEFVEIGYNNLRINIDQKLKNQCNLIKNKKIVYKISFEDNVLALEFAKMFTFFEEKFSLSDTFLSNLLNFTKFNNKNTRKKFRKPTVDQNSNYKIGFLENKNSNNTTNGWLVIDKNTNKLSIFDLPKHKNFLQFYITDGISIFTNQQKLQYISMSLTQNTKFMLNFTSANRKQEFISEIKVIYKEFEKTLTQHNNERKKQI
ncbi:hypothetical protein M0813_02029 [Anaeramoeba flamelloides]|uniref:Uncharacterized protein n=1 Tax=Anaeramoeba flamelloides TaxID=1746091 RepID=A0ABQ8YQA8_9EUKA|nr:hypothetical protein M0813_02029 [Anaeramoeba flamelloides]